MINVKGRINKKGDIVLHQGQFYGNTVNNDNFSHSPSEINIELSVCIDLNDMINGLNGFVWATKNSLQAEIISNSLKVQNIELDILKLESENNVFHLIKVIHERDVKTAIDFIQNDQSGLQLKPDWFYPEGERNDSFEHWVKS